MNDLDKFNKKQINNDLLEIKPGFTVRVHQKVKEGDKQRVQIFEGLVIAKKHGTGINSTITVRKIAEGVGVERIFPIHAPFIEKIEVAKKHKVRRAKLYYIRHKSAKQARLQEILTKTPKKQSNKKNSSKKKTEIKKSPAPKSAEGKPIKKK